MSKGDKLTWWIHLRARIHASHAWHRGSNPLSTTQNRQLRLSVFFCLYACFMQSRRERICEQWHTRRFAQITCQREKVESHLRCGNGVRLGSLLTGASLYWHTTTQWSTFARPLRTHKTKKRITFRLSFLAVRRGLEPLTPCVTGTYSNQLN